MKKIIYLLTAFSLIKSADHHIMPERTFQLHIEDNLFSNPISSTKTCSCGHVEDDDLEIEVLQYHTKYDLKKLLNEQYSLNDKIKLPLKMFKNHDGSFKNPGELVPYPLPGFGVKLDDHFVAKLEKYYEDYKEKTCGISRKCVSKCMTKHPVLTWLTFSFISHWISQCFKHAQDKSE